MKRGNYDSPSQKLFFSVLVGFFFPVLLIWTFTPFFAPEHPLSFSRLHRCQFPKKSHLFMPLRLLRLEVEGHMELL